MEKKSDKKGEPILNKERTNTANKKQRLSACTEAYKEHIMYTFNAFCRVVIRYATLNSWRDRSRKRQREIYHQPKFHRRHIHWEYHFYDNALRYNYSFSRFP